MGRWSGGIEAPKWGPQMGDVERVPAGSHISESNSWDGHPITEYPPDELLRALIQRPSETP